MLAPMADDPEQPREEQGAEDETEEKAEDDGPVESETKRG